MSKNKIKFLVLDLISMIVLIILDQIAKFLAVIGLKDQSAIPLINGVLELNYLENRGAAFGMLQNQKWFFIFIAIIILGAIAYVLVKAPEDKKYIKLHILLTLIAGGAIGNMIDRIRLNYVIDFIYIKIINFPVFNVADMYVTIATFLLIFVMLFSYKEDDLSFINFKQHQYRELK